MIERVKEVKEKILNLPNSKPLKIISHFDTDGITSAAIIARALQRENIEFSLEILKNLENSYVETLSPDSNYIFLDLASGSLPYLEKLNTSIIIIDHHEIPETQNTLRSASRDPCGFAIKEFRDLCNI